MNINSLFELWQFDVLRSLNDRTQLVINKNTNQLMIKKIMGEEEFKIHKKLIGINHKNIVRVYDAIKDKHICTVLEQYIAGKTLEELCYEKIMTEEETKNIILQICCGLQTLHQNNIIHRDLTPSNIMLSDDEVVKIIDFDISRTEKDNSVRDTRILGTEGFAAPEQFGFGQSNAQTDIYALGVLMNFMLTGGKLPSEEMYSGKLSAVIEKCIQIDREKRYKSVDEIVSFLENEANNNISMVDRVIDLIPGLRNPRMFVKVISLIAYGLVNVFCLMCYGTFGKSIQSIIYITIVLDCMFAIPFICFSVFLSFQERLPYLKDIRKSTKRLFFGTIAVICIIIGIIMLPGMSKL